MIKRVQTTLIQAITDAVNLMLIDKGLDSYVNEFTIQMLPPTTQEEIDRRESMSGKVQLAGDIMTMLDGIDDDIVKFKMLKILLSNIVDDNELINLLDEYINNKETTSEEDEVDITESEEEDLGGNDSLSGGDDFSSDFSADMGGDISGDDMMDSGDITTDEAGDLNSELSGTDEEETILPTGDDLGIDLTDTE